MRGYRDQVVEVVVDDEEPKNRWMLSRALSSSLCRCTAPG